MSAEAQNTQEQPKVNDKEYNFRMLEAKYEKQLAQERAARLEAEKAAQEASFRRSQPIEEDDDEEDPYVNKKKLKKELNRFNEQTRQATQVEIQRAVQEAREKERQEAWLENNGDFYNVMEHANKLLEKSPQLAKTILAMPEGFERQKLAYHNIKALGLDKPEVKQQSIQEKVDSNQRGPYYQPSGVGTAPYSKSADFSEAGQKQAHAKMLELKKRLRIS
jgi:hypothetical protein